MAKTGIPFWSNRKLPILVLLGVFVFLASWVILWKPETKFRPVPGSGPPETRFRQVPGSGPIGLRAHSQSTGDVAFALKPGAFHSFKFAVPHDHENASLKGKFSVETRSASTVEAFVLNEEDYISWQNGDTTYRYYDSGDVQQGVLDVPLLAEAADTYYVVFDNDTRAAARAIMVKANMSLIYYTTRWPDD